MRADMSALRALEADGGAKIAARLLEMRDHYAREISPTVARNWLSDAVVYLDENGVYVGTADVPQAVLEKRLPGDSWSAFQTVESWLLATRGAAAWSEFFEVMMAAPHAPRDAVLLMAIANALGKAERHLNEKEGRSKSASGPRAPVTDDELLAHRESFCSKYGTARGWQKRASIDFGMTDSAIRERLKKIPK